MGVCIMSCLERNLSFCVQLSSSFRSAGMFEVDCITSLHRQAHWLPWGHASIG
uniref:Uncharacterized protein n=1 Tax=Timema douglasi TaxID=61478 RepID=A0A7R8VDS6_TIMDO|nr:unnamed protein product [Timema douglasi]